MTSPALAHRAGPAALTDGWGWRLVAWGCVLLLAAGLLAFAQLGRWSELRIATCFFLPLLVLVLAPHGLPSLLVALAAASLAVSAAGWALDWYAPLPWFDLLLHALNPFTIMACSLFMLWKADLAPPPGRGGFLLWAAVLGTAFGIAWELFEARFLDLTWPDTLSDLAMNLLGSILGGRFAAWVIARRGLPPVGRRR